MTEYLPHIITAVVSAAALIAIGWYCHRWGHADGYAEGYERGRSEGLADGYASGVSDRRVRNPALNSGPMRDGGVTPDLSGGPREPA